VFFTQKPLLCLRSQDKRLCKVERKYINQKGGMPLARLQLRPPTREGGEIHLNQLERSLKPLVPQFPLAEPAHHVILVTPYRLLKFLQVSAGYLLLLYIYIHRSTAGGDLQE